MTWKEFKDYIEEKGVTDDMEIESIDIYEEMFSEIYVDIDSNNKVDIY